MKIPKKFKLLGREINIRYDSQLSDNDDLIGLASYRKNLIKLQHKVEGFDISTTNIEVTFCHELTHHILYSMGEEELRKNEKFVEVFSGLLHQALTTMEYDEKV